jgi:uncharacterized membrane-anchored protein
MKRTGLMLVMVVALQVVWIAATAIKTEVRLGGTDTILLETAPVDPRDLLRGDFVILNYKISSIPTNWIPNANAQTLRNQPIFITLEKRGEFYQSVSASLTPPSSVGSNQKVVRGTAETAWLGTPNLRVAYGIERYYVPEGMGNPRGKLTVRCVVNSDRSLLIKQLYLDGKPYAAGAENR